MKDMASDGDLMDAFGHHVKETLRHLEKKDAMLERHGVAADHTDQSIQSLIAEAENWAQMLDDAALRDAGLLASAQRIEHYEIAAYGTLACWAKQLGYDEDLQDLLSILDEEKAADDKLNGLAKREINLQAA